MIPVARSSALVLVLALTGCGVTQVLDRADDGRPIVIRTPQPDADDLRELHAEFGVKTVINLRGKKPDKDWYLSEREGVRDIGARWVHLDVSGTHAPTKETLEEFFSIVEDPDAWPVVVHCMGGVHRTGVMSALYRVQYQGWSPQRAIAEMEDNYFNWTIRDRNALKDFLRDYHPDPERFVDRSK